MSASDDTPAVTTAKSLAVATLAVGINKVALPVLSVVPWVSVESHVPLSLASQHTMALLISPSITIGVTVVMAVTAPSSSLPPLPPPQAVSVRAAAAIKLRVKVKCEAGNFMVRLLLVMDSDSDSDSLKNTKKQHCAAVVRRVER